MTISSLVPRVFQSGLDIPANCSEGARLVFALYVVPVQITEFDICIQIRIGLHEHVADVELRLFMHVKLQELFVFVI